MDLYSIYEMFFSLGYWRQKAAYLNLNSLLITLACAAALLLVFHVLQGLGIYKMAKNREMKNAWLAFVPFANTYYIGKLAGTCSFFGHKTKRAGLYAMIAQIVVFVVCGLLMFAEGYLYTQYSECITFDESTKMFIFSGLPDVAKPIFAAYDIGQYVVSILSLVYQLLLFVMLMGLYRTYSVKNYMILSFLELFVPMSRYIVILVLRNNEAIDFDEYMRKKREDFMRARTQYNPYGNYNPQNPYNSYGNQTSNGGTTSNPSSDKKPEKEEPFGEFSSDKNKGKDDDNPFSL